MTIDPPYGVGGPDGPVWDREPESEENLSALLKQFRLCSFAQFHTVAMYLPLGLIGMGRRVLAANDYAYVQELVWFKANHNLAGPAFALLPSVGEVLLIAYSSAERSVLDRNWIKLNKSPLERPNMIVAPTVHKRKRDQVQRVINPYEKPSCIMSYLVPMMCIEGAKVVVAGAGAMGDALGVVAACYDCVTFERDAVQYKQMAAFLNKHKLVNEMHLCLPFEEVNKRLSGRAGDPVAEMVPEFCCICEAELKNESDGGLCNVCFKKHICEKCFCGFGQFIPKCKDCGAAVEAANSGSIAEIASADS